MLRTLMILTVLVAGRGLPASAADGAERPNILWIVVEDASPHIGCYGETTIPTPRLDQLAEQGVRFTQAFVTCPVCSPSRSAMVSGMYQTTLGAHHHRSQRVSGKGGGNSAYFDSYRVPESIRLIPELFAAAGYYVVNGGNAKTDYNFVPRGELYQGKDWAGRAGGQPFFAQIQLRGGKNRGAKVPDPVDPSDVTLPEHYPDHPVLREDWARYLNSWIATDREVGEILDRLEDEGIADETVVFFWTDHGISHARGKQFLYDEGIHVPLLVRFPDGREAGTTRDDLVTHIDVAASSLALADIPIPEYVEGHDLFAEEYRRQRRIFAARDRCDESVDLIRCVRTKRFKYIRNFLPHVSHMQPNQYKDGKGIIRTMRQLHADGELTALQGRIFAPTRPPEELYDLVEDPGETHNLLQGTMDEQRAHRDTVNVLRLALYDWMIRSGDPGLIPEPVLEELGLQAGNKYAVRTPPSDGRLMWKLIDTIEAGERRDVAVLASAASAEHPAVRWWAATGLGHCRGAAVQQTVRRLLDDPSAGVRVAAAQAICLLGDAGAGLPVLTRALENENLVVGMYAIRGLEMIGESAEPALPAIRKARDGRYEFTRRIARRLSGTLAEQGAH